MKRNFTLAIRLLCFLLILLYSNNAFSQTNVKKTVVQAFWWDYKNDNYPGSWSNYLAELAPRLKSMGVDAIWIPPSYKNNDPAWVGYSPFDHYDLGEKYQKGFVNTAVGTKDELLRMIAIMHANGIEVIQDIVINHVDRAGSALGNGGQDPEATYSMQSASGYKNFRYVSYGTPVDDESECDYFSREGRWPKNYNNFHPHAGHNTQGDEWTAGYWGPDICYGYDDSGTGNGYGQSSNCSVACSATCNDPTQSSGYMRDNVRSWLQWLQKQTAVDGWRFDAVKHFPHFVAEDVIYNTQINGWAGGGDQMFAVGEWVGSKAELDAYTANVSNRAGTFDFGLRAFDGSGGLNGMVTGGGAFDLGDLPGAQQNARYIDIAGQRIHRTVPFVNNHDTYRPQVDANGNITGWNGGDELSTHIDPKEPRLGASYAIMIAMDGNPQIFFEDLFNINNTSARWSHDPKSVSALPGHTDIANIIQAHGALDFKGGGYKVRSSEAGHYNVLTTTNNDNDHIIIERSGKAIIAATDQFNTDQDSWVDSDFAPGTILVDYSGGIATTSVVQADQRVNIKTRAVGYPSYSYSASYTDHGAEYHGYSIWAPQGMSLSYAPPRITTTSQEWEMADDLGDSHCSSLGYGGALPDNSCNWRIAGKIFAEAGKSINYELTPTDATKDITLSVYGLNGVVLSSVSGTGALSGTYTASTTGWYTLKVRNTNNTYAGQNCFVKATYTAPATVTNINSFPVATTVSFWTGNGGDNDITNCRNWEEGNAPTSTADAIVIPDCVDLLPALPPCTYTNILDDDGNAYTGSLGGICVNVKVFLQGPLSGTTMGTALATGGHIPTTEPYTAMTAFTHVNGGGGETATTATFTARSIVDWVFVELRDRTTPATVVASRSALLKSDGSIVDTDGVSKVGFTNSSPDDYYVVVRHRNHLGVSTGSFLALDRTGSSLVDFTTMADGSSWGTLSQKDMGSGIFAMWGGDVDSDGTVAYDGGASPGRSDVQAAILSQPGNIFNSPTFIYNDYSLYDMILDSVISYDGSANPGRSWLQAQILSHPSNIFNSPTFIFTEQLP